MKTLAYFTYVRVGKRCEFLRTRRVPSCSPFSFRQGLRTLAHYNLCLRLYTHVDARRELSIDALISFVHPSEEGLVVITGEPGTASENYRVTIHTRDQNGGEFLVTEFERELQSDRPDCNDEGATDGESWNTRNGKFRRVSGIRANACDGRISTGFSEVISRRKINAASLSQLLFFYENTQCCFFFLKTNMY